MASFSSIACCLLFFGAVEGSLELGLFGDKLHYIIKWGTPFNKDKFEVGCVWSPVKLFQTFIRQLVEVTLH
jgi:hypothetical protein